MEEVDDLRQIEELPKVVQELELVAGRLDVQPVVGVEDDDERAEDDRGLQQTEQPADDLIDEPRLLEERLRPIEA